MLEIISFCMDPLDSSTNSSFMLEIISFYLDPLDSYANFSCMDPVAEGRSQKGTRNSKLNHSYRGIEKKFE